MLQLLDLAKENAALRLELNRIREQTAVLQGVLAAIRHSWATCLYGERCVGARAESLVAEVLNPERADDGPR